MTADETRGDDRSDVLGVARDRGRERGQLRADLLELGRWAAIGIAEKGRITDYLGEPRDAPRVDALAADPRGRGDRGGRACCGRPRAPRVALRRAGGTKRRERPSRARRARAGDRRSAGSTPRRSGRRLQTATRISFEAVRGNGRSYCPRDRRARWPTTEPTCIAAIAGAIAEVQRPIISARSRSSVSSSSAGSSPRRRSGSPRNGSTGISSSPSSGPFVGRIRLLAGSAPVGPGSKPIGPEGPGALWALSLRRRSKSGGEAVEQRAPSLEASSGPLDPTRRDQL